MKGLSKFSFIIGTFFLMVSCEKQNHEKNDEHIRSRYFNLEKIGWKSKSHTQKVDDIGFTATEVPIQYYLLKDKGSEDLFLIDSLYEQNKKERIIEFVFQQEEEKDLLSDSFTHRSYADAVKYMSFGLDKDFYVVTSKKDTISCLGVTYERNYKIAPYQKILLFFSGINPGEKIQLIYKDNLFGKGILKFQFDETYTKIVL